MFAYCDNNPANMLDISGETGVVATIFTWLVKNKVILICAGSTIIGSSFSALTSYLTGGSKEEIYQSAVSGAISGLANSLPETRTATKIAKTAVNVYGVVDSFSSVWEQNGSASDMLVVGFGQYLGHNMYGDLGNGVLYDFAFTFPMDLMNESLIKLVNASNPNRSLPPILPTITAYDIPAISAIGAGCKPDHYLFLQRE